MKTATKVSAIILAAGSSSRIGAFKPLLPLGPSTLVEEAANHFIQAGILDVRIVLGHRHEEVTPLLDRVGLKWILNADHEAGMLSSVLAGVNSLQPDIDAFFLLPVDIPLVKPRTIRALLAASLESNSPVIYPRFQGVRGHPPLIALRCIREDLGPAHEGGLRAFLTRYDDEALDVDVIDQGIIIDCNTPQDYARIRELHARENIPTERESQAIWSLTNTPESVIAHSLVVAEVARLLAVHLNMKGLNINTDLVVAAGCLHDLARGMPNHAKEGARILEELGYPQVAEAVASHMDIALKEEKLGEAELIYMADKCVDGDRVVPLEERFKRSQEKVAGKAHVLDAIQKRQDHVRIIKARIERILGQPIENIFERHKRGVCAASAQRGRAIYLVRHGSVELAGGGRHAIGQLDLPLDEGGTRQAEALRERLRELTLAAVYCSDLKRSIETARIIAEPHCLKPQPSSRLREVALGEWEGRSFDEIRACYPDAYEERGRDFIHYRIPGGESFLDCAQRVIPAFYEILHSTRGSILIAGHAGVNRIILCQVLGWSVDELFKISQDYGCLNVIRYEGSAFRVEIINGGTL